MKAGREESQGPVGHHHRACSEIPLPGESFQGRLRKLCFVTTDCPRHRLRIAPGVFESRRKPQAEIENGLGLRGEAVRNKERVCRGSS